MTFLLKTAAVHNFPSDERTFSSASRGRICSYKGTVNEKIYSLYFMEISV